jgi:DNA uptake protein ComE-like DNA-binding protein
VDEQRPWGRIAQSWLWTFVPIYTLGFGTAAIMAHAAKRTWSLAQALTLPVYLTGLGLVLVPDPDYGGTQETLFSVGMAINMGLGLVHAIVIRSWVWDLAPSTERAAKRRTLRAQQKAALARHDEQEEAREAARRIAVEQPRLAHRLQIGRPDLRERSFPDGGLVDVNHVSARVLTREAGIPDGLAKQIVATRDRVGGFSSIEDMALLADIAPQRLDVVADRLVFLPG